MSTRATVHFTHAKGAKPTAIFYRHSDGYPEGLGKDLAAFLKDIAENVPDNRFGDPSYLAAKWVVADADTRSRPDGSHPCAFLGVGIVPEDPGDIEHRYTVICNRPHNSKEPPEVIHEEVGASQSRSRDERERQTSNL